MKYRPFVMLAAGALLASAAASASAYVTIGIGPRAPLRYAPVMVAPVIPAYVVAVPAAVAAVPVLAPPIYMAPPPAVIYRGGYWGPRRAVVVIR
jgi:hypothetical protein